MMKESQIRIAIQDMERRIQKLEAEAKQQRESPKWLTPNQVARSSNGRYTDHGVRALVDRAIANPSQFKLKAGQHYQRIPRGRGDRNAYKVLWPTFDQILQEQSGVSDATP